MGSKGDDRSRWEKRWRVKKSHVEDERGGKFREIKTGTGQEEESEKM